MTDINEALLVLVCLVVLIKLVEWSTILYRKHPWQSFKNNIRRRAIIMYVGGISGDVSWFNIPHHPGCQQGEWWGQGCSCGVEELNRKESE